MGDIRVLVVDDHAVVREGLRTFLELQDGIVVIGEAADGEQGIAEAERLRPDVVLMDLLMPRLDGVGAMRELRRRLPGIRVIVLTSYADDDRLMPADPGRRRGLPAQERPASGAGPRGARRARGRGRAGPAGGRAAGGRDLPAGRRGAARPPDPPRARGARADRTRARRTSGSHASWRSPRRRSRRTSATCWPSSASPTAPRPRCSRSARGWSRRRGPRPRTNCRWKVRPARA